MSPVSKQKESAKNVRLENKSPKPNKILTDFNSIVNAKFLINKKEEDKKIEFSNNSNEELNQKLFSLPLSIKNNEEIMKAKGLGGESNNLQNSLNFPNEERNINNYKLEKDLNDLSNNFKNKSSRNNNNKKINAKNAIHKLSIQIKEAIGKTINNKNISETLISTNSACKQEDPIVSNFLDREKTNFIFNQNILNNKLPTEFNDIKNKNKNKPNAKETQIPQNVIKRFDWSLLFRDTMELDMHLDFLHKAKASSKGGGGAATIESKDSKQTKTKNFLDFKNLILKSRQTQSSQKELAAEDKDFKKIIVSEKALSNVSVNKEFDLEQEKAKLSDGMCFGEWGLLYGLPRAASVFTMEESHVLYLDKEFFKYCFFKNMYRAVAEKRNFLMKKLPFLRGSSKVEEFLKNVNPLVNLDKKLIFLRFC